MTNRAYSDGYCGPDRDFLDDAILHLDWATDAGEDGSPGCLADISTPGATIGIGYALAAIADELHLIRLLMEKQAGID